MPDVRRGLGHIEEAATRKGGEGFRPFVPELRWKEDGEAKYVLILTPIDEVATLDLHEWIPVGKFEKANGETFTKYEAFLSRKDPFVGETHDRISDDLGRASKTRCMGVAVELEPVLTDVKGRKRPTGFSVKTTTFNRKTDDGEEEVTAPVIGLVTQSSQLMWSPLASYDESTGPLIELPLQITRRGTDANTRYDMVPFMDVPVDLSAVADYVDGISYLKDSLEDVVAAMEAAEDDAGRAQAVALALFDARLSELADGERYDELVGPITELPDKWGKNKKAPASRPSRPARASQRSAEVEAPAEPESTEPSRPDRFAMLKARVENK
jgi:hypothetical protein